MVNRKASGWALGVLLALALGAAAAPAATAAAKMKTVRHTGLVTAVTTDSISLQERHMLRQHVYSYALSSPTVKLARGAPGAMSDVVVGSKVTLVGTQGPDKKVTVTEIQVLAPPKKKK